MEKINEENLSRNKKKRERLPYIHNLVLIALAVMGVLTILQDGATFSLKLWVGIALMFMYFHAKTSRLLDSVLEDYGDTIDILVKLQEHFIKVMAEADKKKNDTQSLSEQSTN